MNCTRHGFAGLLEKVKNNEADAIMPRTRHEEEPYCTADTARQIVDPFVEVVEIVLVHIEYCFRLWKRCRDYLRAVVSKRDSDIQIWPDSGGAGIDDASLERQHDIAVKSSLLYRKLSTSKQLAWQAFYFCEWSNSHSRRWFRASRQGKNRGSRSRDRIEDRRTDIQNLAIVTPRGDVGRLNVS